MEDWEKRFRAGRVGLPQWAEDAPERAVVAATAHGVVELHAWEVGGELRQVTSRKEGTAHGALDPEGTWLWWFDDADGDEHGVWRRQPFAADPGTAVVDATGLPAAYPAGLALGRGGLAVVGRHTDEGTEVHVLRDGHPAKELYRHRESAAVAALSEDGELVAISHSEHGDSRHPALRVLRTADGSVVDELHDGEGKGVEACGFAPRTGDPRLLVLHERAGRGELLVRDVATGAEHPVPVPLEQGAEVADASWTRDGTGVLVEVDFQARTTLVRVELMTGAAAPVGPRDGSVLASTPRPDGDTWYLWSSASQPPAVRSALADEVLLTPPGEPAPPSVPVEDLWVDGPGGRVHALVRRPATGSAPYPTVVEVHGGPTHHDSDAFRAYAAAWVDHGYAVVQVNYRGSTGYGSAWRDALDAAVGLVELEDVAAVRAELVRSGLSDPDRLVLAGASWGGFLTLLGLGTQPDDWSLGIAGVPVADYVAAYEDEMEGLKAFDRALFGGSPAEVPEAYERSSPLTYVDAVRVPVLVLAGENDPRCPIRQIENYVGALERRGVPHELYRYDAGHGSLVDDERVRQVRVELEFAAQHLPQE